MQFRISFSLKEPLTLPLAYHSQLQGLIYKTLSVNPEFTRFLHDNGYRDQARSFKLFVYSLLYGPCKVAPPNITFYDHITFELRSPLTDFCTVLLNALVYCEEWALNRQPIDFGSCVVTKDTIEKDEVRIRMKSPLCLHTTYYEDGRRKTRYYTPLDVEYHEALNRNLQSKYHAALGYDPEGAVHLKVESLSSEDKYVTKFDNIYITAWNGVYTLSGDPAVLSFLYDTGLGDRSSQGFGMFELL